MHPPIALFYLIAAPALYGLISAMLKRGAEGIPPFTAMSISMGALFGCSLLCAVIFEREAAWSTRESTFAVTMLLLVGVVNTLALFFAIGAYRYVALWEYQLFALLTPLFAAAFAYLLLGEPISPKLLISLALMASGLYIAVR